MWTKIWNKNWSQAFFVALLCNCNHTFFRSLILTSKEHCPSPCVSRSIQLFPSAFIVVLYLKLSLHAIFISTGLRERLHLFNNHQHFTMNIQLFHVWLSVCWSVFNDFLQTHLWLSTGVQLEILKGSGRNQNRSTLQIISSSEVALECQCLKLINRMQKPKMSPDACISREFLSRNMSTHKLSNLNCLR